MSGTAVLSRGSTAFNTRLDNPIVTSVQSSSPANRFSAEWFSRMSDYLKKPSTTTNKPASLIEQQAAKINVVDDAAPLGSEAKDTIEESDAAPTTTGYSTTQKIGGSVAVASAAAGLGALAFFNQAPIKEAYSAVSSAASQYTSAALSAAGKYGGYALSTLAANKDTLMMGGAAAAGLATVGTGMYYANNWYKNSKAEKSVEDIESEKTVVETIIEKDVAAI